MFTLNDLKSIAKNAGFPGPADDNTVLQKSKKERLDIIRTSDDLEEKSVAAAIEIQRFWRGYFTRSMLFAVLHPYKSLSPNAGSRVTKNLSSVSTFSNLNSNLSNKSSTTIKLTHQRSSTLRGSYHSYKEIVSSSHEIPISFQEFCATIIQRWWKDMRLKKLQRPSKTSRSINDDDIPSTRSSYIGNTVDKSEIRISLMKSPSHQATTSEDKAATVIQRSWRRHIDMQVYKYYKDLINFKSEGDPAMMLKCINPVESSLLDSASGAHVRFRLGGDQFPPNIYYKIFTNRNIADIGSFAPRNYTQAECKKLPMKHVHNKGISSSSESSCHHGWYERLENNGWRPVSDKMLRHVYQDTVTHRTSQKKLKFHHSKLVRKEDLAKRKKARKIEWMKKMYREGALKINEDDSNIKSLIESATKGVTDSSQTQLHESVDEWEVDELLEWTSGLNFEKYTTDWKELGTTAKTNSTGTQNTQNFSKDPFTITLST